MDRKGITTESQHIFRLEDSKFDMLYSSSTRPDMEKVLFLVRPIHLVISIKYYNTDSYA